MRKVLMIVIGLVFLGLTGFAILAKKPPEPVGCTLEAKLCPDGSAVGRSGPACEFAPCPNGPVNPLPKVKAPEFVPPLERSGERVTKKPFGIFIDPVTSPVQPERFRGYHTGTDFETFPEEAKSDVSVRAICSGQLAVKRSASGYGGVVVEHCAAAGQPITVVYGHLRLTSVTQTIGEAITAGDIIGNLGTGHSQETDGERKHLHLGVHKGSAVDIRGYVADQSELDGWLDACQLFSCSLSSNE